MKEAEVCNQNSCADERASLQCPALRSAHRRYEERAATVSPKELPQSVATLTLTLWSLVWLICRDSPHPRRN